MIGPSAEIGDDILDISIKFCDLLRIKSSKRRSYSLLISQMFTGSGDCLSTLLNLLARVSSIKKTKLINK